MPNPSYQFCHLVQVAQPASGIACFFDIREQIIQDKLHREGQQFEAWKLEVENKTLVLQSQLTQPQVQPPPVRYSGPGVSETAIRDVEVRSVRSVSSRRSRTRWHPLLFQTSCRSLSLQRDKYSY